MLLTEKERASSGLMIMTAQLRRGIGGYRGTTAGLHERTLNGFGIRCCGSRPWQRRVRL